jgi:3-methyl-2-oxobutanoate hydroxymethyltransferase
MSLSPPTSGKGIPEEATPRVTLQTLRRMAKAGEPFAALTCYDATTARWLARGGVHVLLVGDTAAEVILGLPRTIDMPLDVLLALTAGVKRGAPKCVVMGDMPFMSYQADDASAIRNAGRFLTEGMADIVKLEADARLADRISKIVHAGIPVCGHVGSRPQYVALTGGYAAAGRTPDAAKQVVEDAVALERAGCAMLLIEAVPAEVTEAVLAMVTVPVIGIGAGPACHGQVLVLQDLVSMSERPPRFAEPVANLGRSFQDAAAEWVSRVSRRAIGGQGYRMLGGSPPGADAGKVGGAGGHDDGMKSLVRPGEKAATGTDVAGSS